MDEKMDHSGKTTEGQRRLVLSPCIPIENFTIDITSDGKLLGIGCNKSVTVYNIMTLDELDDFQCDTSIQKIAFSPDQRYLACMLHESNDIDFLVFNINESALCITLKGDNNFSSINYSSMLWSPKSNFLWFTWNAKFSTDILQVKNKKRYLFEGNKLDEFNQALCCFSPDENYYLAVQRTLPCTLMIYSTDNFLCLKTCTYDDMKDVNGISWLLDSSCFCLWEPTIALNFQVWSLDGRLQHKLSSDLSEYGVRQIAKSPCTRLLATMQNKKTEITLYDTLTWNAAAILCHNEKSYKQDCVLVLDKMEAQNKHSENSSSLFCWYAFSANDQRTEETKVNFQKTENELTSYSYKQSYLEFSSCGQFIATYNPAFKNCIWIWNLHSHVLLEKIIKIKPRNEESSFRDLKWHPSKPYLYINLRIDIIIWNPTTQSAFIVHHKSEQSLRCYWCNTTTLLLAICTSNRLCFTFENINKLL